MSDPGVSSHIKSEEGKDMMNNFMSGLGAMGGMQGGGGMDGMGGLGVLGSMLNMQK